MPDHQIILIKAERGKFLKNKNLSDSPNLKT